MTPEQRQGDDMASDSQYGQHAQDETSEYVRSLALSSAKLWEALFERIHSIEAAQAELHQFLASVQAAIPVGNDNPALPPSEMATMGTLEQAAQDAEEWASPFSGAANGSRDVDAIPAAFGWSTPESPHTDGAPGNGVPPPPPPWAGTLSVAAAQPQETAQHAPEGLGSFASPSSPVADPDTVAVPPPPPEFGAVDSVPPPPPPGFGAVVGQADEAAPPPPPGFESLGTPTAPPPPPGFGAVDAVPAPPPPPPPGFGSIDAAPPPPPPGFGAVGGTGDVAPPPPPPGFGSIDAAPPPPPPGFGAAVGLSEEAAAPPPGFVAGEFAEMATAASPVNGAHLADTGEHHLHFDRAELTEEAGPPITPDFFARAGRRRH